MPKKMDGRERGSEPRLIAIRDEDKQSYLDKNSPIDLDVNEQRKCIHCEQIIKVRDFKVVYEPRIGEEFIYCPNWPACNGTVIDWWSLSEE